VRKTDRQKKQNQHSPFEKRLRPRKIGNKDKENSQQCDKKEKKKSAYRQNMKDDFGAIHDSNELSKIKERNLGKLIDIRA